MYILELLFKYLQKDKVENLIEQYDSERSPNLLDLSTENEDDCEVCEHVFMPIDSTHETFACINCGILIDKKTYEERNFFKDKKD